MIKRFLYVFGTALLVLAVLGGCSETTDHAESTTGEILKEEGWTYPGDTISEEFVFTGILGRFSESTGYDPYGLTFVNKTHHMTVPYYFLVEEGMEFRLSPPNSNAGFIITVKEIDVENNRVKLTVKEVEL